MHIALFGGSGRTGAEFIPRALAAGHTITALARTPEKITTKDDKLTVLPGDVTDAAAVAKAIQGADAVVSLLGQTKGGTKDVQTVGTRNMVIAMQQAGVQRIISMSGGGVPFPKDEPKFADKAIRGIMGLFFKSLLKDATDHLQVLQNSDLDWTVVRAPRLVDEADKGTYKVGYVGTTGGTKISRGDVAMFLLAELGRKDHVRDAPFISW